MPRRTDANQRAIVAALRQVGASVQLLHKVGGGCPDLLVGFRGRNVLIEIKTDDGELNGLQRDWHRCWRGQVAVVRTVDEALAAIGAVAVPAPGGRSERSTASGNTAPPSQPAPAEGTVMIETTAFWTIEPDETEELYIW